MKDGIGSNMPLRCPLLYNGATQSCRCKSLNCSINVYLMLIFIVLFSEFDAQRCSSIRLIIEIIEMLAQMSCHVFKK